MAGRFFTIWDTREDLLKPEAVYSQESGMGLKRIRPQAVLLWKQQPLK